MDDAGVYVLVLEPEQNRVLFFEQRPNGPNLHRHNWLEENLDWLGRQGRFETCLKASYWDINWK